MNIIKISSFAELKDTFDDLMSKNSIFRGINNRTQMLPKLIRSDVDCSSKEISILEAFERYYGIYSTANNCWEFLALAQHCGLMTRLVDFSYNPYVALFFSLYQKTESGTYEIWSIKKSDCEMIFDFSFPVLSVDENEGTLNINDNATTDGKTFSAILDYKFKNIESSNNIITIKPNYRNARMMMQQGLFVIPTNVCKESIINCFEEKSIVIVIDEKLRDEALDYLDKLGFNERHLMPDLDSLCYDINHKALENKEL